MQQKKSEVRKRKHFKAFRLNDEELEKFRQNCTAAKLTEADYIRSKCCGVKPIRYRRKHTINEKQLAKALAQLGKIGSNINQIAHVFNQAAKVAPDHLADIVFQYEDLFISLSNELNEERTFIRQILLGHDTESE